LNSQSPSKRGEKEKGEKKRKWYTFSTSSLVRFIFFGDLGTERGEDIGKEGRKKRGGEDSRHSTTREFIPKKKGGEKEKGQPNFLLRADDTLEKGKRTKKKEGKKTNHHLGVLP